MAAEGGEGELLTLQEAADRLKVHYMTAYRWVRRGDLQAFKAGGRLRVRLDDVEGFVRRRRVDVALPHPTGRTTWPVHVERLFGLLLDGRAMEAGGLVRKVVADGAPAGDVYLNLVTPALYRVGDAWAAGKISVAQEHRASEICSAVLARTGEAFRRRGPSRGTVATVTPPDELHGLGAVMVADFLRGGGYDVHHLGTNVPYRDLALFLQVVPCDVLCVSVTTTGYPATYESLVRTLGGGPGKVVVGGQGADPQAATDAGAHHVPALDHLLPRLEELVSA